MHSLETEVIAMVAAERGLPPLEIARASRLSHDLGMDGDDAVDFFASIEDRFGTDLTNLYEHWGHYFDREPPGLTKISFAVMLVSGITSFAIGAIAARALDIKSIWFLWLVSSPLWIALFVMCSRALRSFGYTDERAPITVAEVIQAVERGSWLNSHH